MLCSLIIPCNSYKEKQAIVKKDSKGKVIKNNNNNKNMPTVSVSNRQDSKDIHKVTKIIIYCSSTSFISCNAVCYIQGKTRGAFAKKDNKDNQKHFNVG